MTRRRARYADAGLLTKLAYRIVHRYDRRVQAKRRKETLAAPQATPAELRAAGEAMEHQRKFKNPIPSHRSIFGRQGKTYLDGLWVAVLVGIKYTLGAEGRAGGGEFSVEKVNSCWEQIITDPEKRKAHELRIELDDAGMPNPEVIVLKGVELQSLTGGYDLNDVVAQTVFFSYESWELETPITENLQVETWETVNG